MVIITYVWNQVFGMTSQTLVFVEIIIVSCLVSGFWMMIVVSCFACRFWHYFVVGFTLLGFGCVDDGCEKTCN